MCTATLKQALPDESLAQQQLNIFFCPLPGRQGLQKHHNLLKVHFAKLVGPLDEESGADVKVEGRETVFFSLIYVSDAIRNIECHVLDRCPTFVLCS